MELQMFSAQISQKQLSPPYPVNRWADRLGESAGVPRHVLRTSPGEGGHQPRRCEWHGLKRRGCPPRDYTVTQVQLKPRSTSLASVSSFATKQMRLSTSRAIHAGVFVCRVGGGEFSPMTTTIRVTQNKQLKQFIQSSKENPDHQTKESVPTWVSWRKERLGSSLCCCGFSVSKTGNGQQRHVQRNSGIELHVHCLRSESNTLHLHSRNTFSFQHHLG